jgi:hypothetical protein
VKRDAASTEVSISAALRSGLGYGILTAMPPHMERSPLAARLDNVQEVNPTAGVDTDGSNVLGYVDRTADSNVHTTRAQM